MNPSKITIRLHTENHNVMNFAVRALFVVSTVLFLNTPACLEAATITATDCSYAAVQKAVSSANRGDTVKVPAGKAIWANTLVINNDIQLIGAGAGRSIITNNVPRNVNSGADIVWETTANGMCRLSGFTFQGGKVDTNHSFGAILNIGGTCHAVRIDNCNFTLLNQYNIIFYGWVYGVVDHCNFTLKQVTAIEVNHDAYGGGQYGDGSWAAPDNWGTTNALYIETCNFYAGLFPGTGLLDSVNGARVVIRFNNSTNCPIGSHGTESTGRARSVRSYEIYNNNFQWPTNRNSSFVLTMYLRGGTATIFSNTIYGGFQSMLDLATYRECPNHFTAWDNITGANVWDSNSATIFASGTAMGPNRSSNLQDTNKHWTNNWSGYFLHDITLDLGIPIGSNNVSTITFNGYNPYGSSFAINNGDSYEIRKVYAAIDQCGYGQGDLLSGATPINTVTGTQTWPHEAPDPIYEWGNKFAFIVPGYASYKVSSQNTTTAGTWVDDVARPGYMPLIYPHPLTLVTNELSLPIPVNLQAH